MALRNINNQGLQNYPKIQIDSNSVIKPCIAEKTSADQFIDRPASNWKKVVGEAWQQGVPFILNWISNLKTPTATNPYLSHVIRLLKYIAMFLLYLHRIYLQIYGYFYPYSLMPLDDVCDEFSRCPRWTESLIRAFAWHPNQDKCALAVCNDYIYVYHGPVRVRVLRHNHQRKILDLAWQPSEKDVIVVATQTHIIIWRVTENQNAFLGSKEQSQNSKLGSFAPNVFPILRDRDLRVNGAAKAEPNNTPTLTDSQGLTSTINFKIIENVLPPPIVSIQFDKSGERLFACSPNSSKIAILHVNDLFNSNVSNKTHQHINYIRHFGQGNTKLLWSPNKDRLIAATTSSQFRIYEPFSWSWKKWTIDGGLIQDFVWSNPGGRLLLVANKTEPTLYALPFLDAPQSGDVGGNKSLMKALDLTATRSEFGDMVGGRVQAFAWDKNGKRLAISFKDNPESILLYRTNERPTVEFHQLGLIRNDNGSTPLLMEFHEKYKNGSLLTICWSDGNCQHITFNYGSQERTQNGFLKDDSHNGYLNLSKGSLQGHNSPAPAPRHLTDFCHVSGNNSISSFASNLAPINKNQHQTTLFSLGARSNFSETNSNSNESDKQ